MTIPVAKVLPQPSLHKTWQEWGFKLIRILAQPETIQMPQMQVLTVAQAQAIRPGEGFGPVLISDEVGGVTLAFADGTNWRRVTDNAVIS